MLSATMTNVPRLRHITNILFFLLAVYAALFGITFAYQLHVLANLVCAWLVIVHFSAVGLSPRALTKMWATGVDGSSSRDGGCGSSSVAGMSHRVSTGASSAGRPSAIPASGSGTTATGHGPTIAPTHGAASVAASAGVSASSVISPLLRNADKTERERDRARKRP